MNYWVFLPSLSQTILSYKQACQTRGFDLRCLLTDGGFPEAREHRVNKSSMKIINNTLQYNNTTVLYVQNKQVSLLINPPQLGVR